MNGRSLSGLTMAWIAIATTSIVICCYCFLAVLSGQEKLSERTADLKRSYDLAVKTAALPNATDIAPGMLKTAIGKQLSDAGVSATSQTSVRMLLPERVEATLLSAAQYRVSLPEVQLRSVIRFLQAIETNLPDLTISSISLKPPKSRQQKMPETWTMEVVLTHTTEAR